MPPRSMPLVAVPSHPPESEPIPPPTSPSPDPALLWNRLDLPRRRLFAQRLALLLHRRHAALEVYDEC
jgi:hypothetical protein